MRKLIFNLALSLDGFIEGPNGEFDWCFTDQDYGMTEFMESIDAVLFGRKSYELMLQFEAAPYPDKMKYVVSRHYKTDAANTFVISENIAEAVGALKQQPGKHIWLFGGAKLAGELMVAGLIDELLISLHPVLLGKGKMLFEDLNKRVSLELLDSKTYESGLVQLQYKVQAQINSK